MFNEGAGIRYNDSFTATNVGEAVRVRCGAAGLVPDAGIFIEDPVFYRSIEQLFQWT